MRTATMAAAALALASVATAAPLKSSTAPFVGAYFDATGPDGLAKLQLLAENAATLPINRLWLAFVSPTLVYVPGSKTLAYTGLNAGPQSGDYGFAAVQTAIAQLSGAGVDVLISMGGWDYNCFSYAYTRYSVAGYGTSTPNYWKVQQYCGGDLDNASPANEFCYTCEPPSANETLSSFGMFPEPYWSPSWTAAVSYVTATAGGGNAPVWDQGLVPGSVWTDPKTGINVTVPGNPLFATMRRDPYQDLVYLAKDLGAQGVDVDYEEDWHADMNKYGTGPYTLPQTVYKYAAILKDVQLAINKTAPSLMLSTAAGAAGAWSTNWWGGNLKGVWYYANQWYPDLVAFVASTGGINVMTYDLSDDEQYYECPTPSICTLDQQVNFYMGTYAAAGIPANVGYETGTPAYPDPVEDPTHQLPLTQSELQLILSATQPSYAGGFMWEVYKQPVVAGEATPTQVAQAICRVVMPSSPRCSGSLPVWNGSAA